jgi:prepilin-type N-terminal cleavage/methylation domain-containing protein
MTTNSRGQSGAGSSSGRAVVRRAFTLVEILISVAALALIAVGLATIFGAIGRTVTAGKSVSAFTSYAALIERQMRADFAGMSREFPLVIRNEWAGDISPAAFNQPKRGIPLFPGDTNLRARRIDEIIFGVKGRAASARAPLWPGRTARGDSYRVYFGHGQRRIEDLAPGSLYLRPTLDDPNDDPAAGVGVNNPANPNRYASDWTLQRHVTVFARPTTTDDAPSPLSDGVVYLDNEVQIGLQPAASSPFRKLAIVTPDNVPPPAPYDNLVRDPVHPQFAGGIVDVVTSDFAEVRAVVTTANLLPVDINNELDLVNAIAQGAFDPNDPTYNVNQPDVPSDTIERMHSWMDELFPTWSMAPLPNNRVRIRYEPAAPDYFAPLKQLDEIRSDWGRADQVMLSSSNFLPQCSEFIVEWSFGKVWTPLNPDTPGWEAAKSGTPIWHGMTRRIALDPLDPANLTTIAQPYDEDLLIDGLRKLEFKQMYRRIDGQMGEYPVTRVRIHNEDEVAPPPYVRPRTSYFGYVDPQFNPADPLRDDNDGADSDGDGLDADLDDTAASSSIPWAWPELIRITISLADPNNPSVEQTFQFVFDAPGNPVR